MTRMDQYYAILPCARLLPEAHKFLAPSFIHKRTSQRALIGLPEEPYNPSEWVPATGMEYSMRLTRILILDLATLIETNSLYKEFAPCEPKPILRVLIASKRQSDRVVLGQSPLKSRRAKTPELDTDTVLPRIIREKLKPTRMEVLSSKQKVTLLYNLLLNEDMCADDPWGFVDSQSENLLKEEKLGWASIGKDGSPLQIWPEIGICEKELTRLINLPISTIGTIPQITAAGSVPVALDNFSVELAQACAGLKDLLQFSLYGPIALLAILRQFDYLVHPSQSTELKKLIDAHIGDYAGLGKEMRQIRSHMHVISERFPGRLQFGFIEADLNPAKSEMLRNGAMLLANLLQELTWEYIGLLNHAMQLFIKIKDDLRRVPKTVEELKVISEYLDTRQDEAQFFSIKAIITQTNTILGLFREFQHALDPVHEQKIWETKVWAAELQHLRARAVIKLNHAKPAFIDQVLTDSAELRKVGESVKSTIAEFEQYRDVTNADVYASVAKEIVGTLQTALVKAETVNFRESVLRIKMTDFGDFREMEREFQKYCQLWTFASQWATAWNEWNYRSFRSVDPESVKAKYNEGVHLLTELEAGFKSHPMPMEVVSSLQAQMEAFKGYVHIVMQLRQPAIHERHIDLLLETIGVEGKPDNITLLDLAKGSVLDYQETIDKICHDARNEYEIELVLHTAENEISSFELNLQTDEDFPGLHYLTGLRNAEEMVQELQVTLSFLSASSKYVGYFRQKIEKMAISLTISLQVIRDIAEFQERWTQVYPLLQLPEVAGAVKSNSELVEDLQAFYTRQVQLVHSTQSLTVASDAKIKNFVEAIERCESLWKQVKKIINEKSDSFARLLFLSPKEQMRYFSKVARGKKVKLSLIFPGIEPVNLGNELKEVYHGKVAISLNPPIALMSLGVRVKPEVWMQTLESTLHRAFQSLVTELFEVMEKKDDWWKACADPQLLVVTEQLFFCKLIFNSGKSRKEAVENTIECLRKVLACLVAEICPLSGTTDKKMLLMFKRASDVEEKLAARKRLEKLALQVMNQLHILHTAVATSQFQEDDFIWRSFFHMTPHFIGKSLELVVSFFDSAQAFGFEWSPLPLPLFVATPVADRCMLNLATALKNGASALLQGKGGNSKTETLKELALMHGRLLLIWTVSKVTHPASVLQALCGCLITGAWMCFEEVHLLDAFHLNSLSYYLTKIREVITTPGSKLDIEGRIVSLNPGFAFWGMSTFRKVSFPACVADCFRVVSMSKPDITVIAEVRLYALGFTMTANELGKKVAKVLSFWEDDCSSVTRLALSKQRRVANLRVANLIIDTIARMLDTFVFSDVNYLLSNAFRKVLGVGLPREEVVLLDEFLTTVFHATCNDTIIGAAVHQETQLFLTALRAKGYNEGEEVMRKLRHIRICLQDTDRKLIMITGSAGSGKSTLMKIAIDIHSKLEEAFSVPVLSGQVSNMHMHRLIQACVSGVETTLFPHIALVQQAKFSPQDIIYLDTESLSPDGLLAVARNDIYLQKELRIEVPQSLRVIAELESLEHVSPDLLTEACLLYCDDEVVPETDLFKTVITGSCPDSTIPVLKNLFIKYFGETFAMFKEAKPAIHIPRKTAVISLSNWLCMLIGPPTVTVERLTSLKLETKNQYRAASIAERVEQIQQTEVEAAWIVALIGSLGAMVDEKPRFNAFLLEMCARERPDFAASLLSAVDLHDTLSVFRLNFSFSQKLWCRWEACAIETRQDSVLIPTEGTMRLQCWVNRNTVMHKHCLVVGPHQSGKTLVFEEVLRKRVSEDFASIIPLNVLYGTTCDSIQYEVERMMDQYRPKHFGALGGRHHYVFLEDMNQDTKQIYDMVRFLLEYRGWYKRDAYSAINDATFCLAHSYSTHKFRRTNFRALRHFVVIFKEEYPDEELCTLFGRVDMRFADAFIRLFRDLREAVLKMEGMWHHSTLSNFIPALHWVKRAGRWTSMLRRHFTFLDIDSAQDPSFFAPSITLSVDNPEAEPYVQITEQNFPKLLSTFEQLTEKCTSKHPDAMKAVRRSMLHQDARLALQLYHFSQITDDLLLNQHSIIATRRDLASLHAVILMAAELTGYRVVDITLFDMTSELANSMAEREGHYLPTEAKFAIKQMVDSALRGEKSACLVAIEDESNINSPIFRSFMEVVCDIVLAKSLKSYSITRKAHKQYRDLYPDQVMLLQRDLIQNNILFCFLIRSSLHDFNRCKTLGPLETLKHTYRSLFNQCRVAVYEDQMLPGDLLACTKTMFKEANSDLELFEAFSVAVKRPLDDFVWERVSYLASAMQSWEDTEINTELSYLQRALARLSQIEQELDKSEYLTDLHESIEALRKQSQNARKDLAETVKGQIESEEDMAKLIDEERREFLQLFEGRKKKMQMAINIFFDCWQPLGEKPSLYILILLGGLQRLVHRSEEQFPFFDPALYFAHCGPILHKMEAKPKEVMKKLQSLEIATLPDLSQFLGEVRGSPVTHTPIHSLIVALEEVRTTTVELSVKQTIWSEGKLVNPRVSDTTRARQEAERIQIEILQKQLKEAEERLQASLTLRQKLLRFVNDLKPSQKDWSERCQVLAGQKKFTKGNSLLHASIYVLALSEEKSSQDSLKSVIREVLESRDHPCSHDLQQVDKGVTTTPFLRNAIRACDWIWKLVLPYPVFIDQVGIVCELIRDPGLVTVRYSLDTRLDASFETCIEAGKSLLIVEPTEGMLMALMPLFRWRHHRSIEATKGEQLRSVVVTLGRKRLKVHKDFRLYLSLTAKPGDILARVSTVISLESSDAETWQAGMMLQLFKTAHLQTSDGRTHREQVSNVETMKAISDTTFESVYTSQALRNVLKTVQKVNISKQPLNDSMSSDEESQTSVLQQTYSELLSIVSELNRLLRQLRLGKWTVPAQMIQKLLVLSCDEQIRSVGLPSEAQTHLFQEPIFYRFLVRLLWTLPAKYQNAVLLCYCLQKSGDEGRAMQAIELVVQGIALEFTLQEEELKRRAAVLQERWASYPASFSPDTSEFRRFVFRDLYSDAALPDLFDACTQAVLIAWLRPDLISEFVKTLVKQVLGRRFSYLPEADLGLVAEFAAPTMPIALMYKQRDPLPGLKQSAHLAGTTVSHLLPLASKKTHFVSESKLQLALKTLSSSCKRKEWLVLEGFEALEKSQIEQLFIQMVEILRNEEVSSDFRLWFIFQQAVDLLPDWDLLMKNCFRVCYREPETVRERLITTQELYDLELYEGLTNNIKLTYAKHTQIELGHARKTTRKITRFNPLLKFAHATPRGTKADVTASSSSTPRRSIGSGFPAVDPAVASKTVSDFLRFNLSFVTAALELRQLFDSDIPMHLSWKEMQVSLIDSISAFATKAEENIREAGKETILLYLRLIGSSWGEIGFVAALNLAKHAVISNTPALKFGYTNFWGEWNAVQYPLFQLAAPTSYENVLLDMPRQDHLHLIGLPNYLNRMRQREKSLKLTKVIHSISPQLDSSLQTKRCSIAETLSNYLDKITYLSSLTPVLPADRTVFTDLYEKISHERIRGFSYFFVPDRYRMYDYQLKILSHPVDRNTILSNFERTNQQRFALFLKTVRDECNRLLGFLQYRTAQISAGDSKKLRRLKKLRVPGEWSRLGPYTLRHEQNSDSYIAKLTKPVFFREGVIQLQQVSHPGEFLTTLFRTMTLISGVDFGKAEFEMNEHDGDMRTNSVLIEGWQLYNGSLKGYLLKDAVSDEPLSLPVCRFSVAAAGKEDEEKDLEPHGVFVHYRGNASERLTGEPVHESELCEMIRSAFNYQRTKWIEKQSDENLSVRANKVVCPMLKASTATRFWVTFASDKPQSHWSKRGTLVDLP